MSQHTAQIIAILLFAFAFLFNFAKAIKLEEGRVYVAIYLVVMAFEFYTYYCAGTYSTLLGAR